MPCPEHPRYRSHPAYRPESGRQVPNDPQSPFVTSGIRLGAAAMTTRGFKEDDMKEVARIIAEAIKNSDDEKVLNELRLESAKLCKKYPLY